MPVAMNDAGGVAATRLMKPCDQGFSSDKREGNQLRADPGQDRDGRNHVTCTHNASFGENGPF
jgi:hypothetical protein